MNSKIEEGFKTWLSSAGVSGDIFTGFTEEKQPTNRQTVTVFVSECARKAGPLYLATIKLIIATPPHDTSQSTGSLEKHREKCEAIRELLEEIPDSLKVSFNASTDLFSHGGWLNDAGDSTIDGGKWVTTMDFSAGIATEDVSG